MSEDLEKPDIPCAEDVPPLQNVAEALTTAMNADLDEETVELLQYLRCLLLNNMQQILANVQTSTMYVTSGASVMFVTVGSDNFEPTHDEVEILTEIFMGAFPGSLVLVLNGNLEPKLHAVEVDDLQRLVDEMREKQCKLKDAVKEVLGS